MYNAQGYGGPVLFCNSSLETIWLCNLIKSEHRFLFQVNYKQYFFRDVYFISKKVRRNVLDKAKVK